MHKILDKFKPYVEKGLVREVISPCGRLVLYNYTDACTYERAWDDVTLNARGTVYEIETGNIVARAFPKFFNYGELSEEKQKEVLDSTNFDVFEKMDGSLGIVYFYDGEWRVNTRGSFTSDQAIKGKGLLDSKYDTSGLVEGITLLVEIIYPENKIIVDYGKEEKLVILASFGMNGGELPYLYEDTGMEFAPKKSFSNIDQLMAHLKTLDHTEEGYVVRLLHNGERVKFKSAEYLALARIMSNMSPLTFWDKLDEQGKIDREFLQQLPEEFRDECDKIADTLEDQFQKKYADVVGAYEVTLKGIGIEPPSVVTNDIKKEVGLYLKNNVVNDSAAVFSYLLGNESGICKYIKKQIKPVGNVLKDI